MEKDKKNHDMGEQGDECADSISATVVASAAERKGRTEEKEIRQSTTFAVFILLDTCILVDAYESETKSSRNQATDFRRSIKLKFIPALLSVSPPCRSCLILLGSFVRVKT